MSSNGVTLMPSFVKIYHLVQSGNEYQTHRRQGWRKFVYFVFPSLILSIFEKVMWALKAASDISNFGDCLQNRKMYIDVCECTCTLRHLKQHCDSYRAVCALPRFDSGMDTASLSRSPSPRPRPRPRLRSSHHCSRWITPDVPTAHVWTWQLAPIYSRENKAQPFTSTPPCVHGAVV
jgi:hypothetical protein